MKTCTKCGREYPSTAEYFYRDKKGAAGLSAQCKTCADEYQVKYRRENQEKIRDRYRKWAEVHEKHLAEYSRKYRAEHPYDEKKRARVNELQRKIRLERPERDREWRVKHRQENPEYYEKWTAYRREQYKKNPEKYREFARKYYHANKEKCYARSRQWQEQNPEKVREARRRQYRENPERFAEVRARQRENPKWRLNNSMRVGIYNSLKSGKNGFSWESLVGYSLDDLIAHLEPLFRPGMTWDNHGEWHIDHIKPISHFDFETYKDPEFLECWSLWNLQPLWATENLSKNNRVDEVPLPLLHKVDVQP